MMVLWLFAFGAVQSPSPGIPNEVPGDLEGLQVGERLGETVPLEISLVNDSGRVFTLQEIFREGKPVILSFAYYSCSMLCPLVLDGIADALRGMDLKAGRDFLLLTVSVDPGDTPEKAREASKTHRHGIVSRKAWRFAVGDSAQVRRLARAVGFPYRKVQDDPVMYAHPAMFAVLTPEGRISRYFYGVDYNPRDLKLALLEAGQGKIGGIAAKVLLYCYRFDPRRGTYTLVAVRVMQLAGLLTTLLVGGMLGMLWIREKRRRFPDGHA